MDFEYFNDAYFSCDYKEKSYVIYRSKLSSTSTVSSAKLIDFLQVWIANGAASVILYNSQLYFEPSCKVEIRSFSDPLCPYEGSVTEISTTFSPTQLKALANNYSFSENTIIILTVAMVVIVLVVICALIIFKKINFRLVDSLI